VTRWSDGNPASGSGRNEARQAAGIAGLVEALSKTGRRVEESTASRKRRRDAKLGKDIRLPCGLATLRLCLEMFLAFPAIPGHVSRPAGWGDGHRCAKQLLPPLRGPLIEPLICGSIGLKKEARTV
jgi:hypothetical protein